MQSLGRRFHGNAVADELALRSPVLLDGTVALAAVAFRLHRTIRRRNTEAWERARAENVAATQELLSSPEEDVLYEVHRDEHSPVGG
jgi:hypothetical protein